MKCSEENPVFVVVVDIATRKVIDAQRFTYGPYLDDVITRHDLSKVDIVLRGAQSTVLPPEESNVVEAPEEPSPQYSTTLDDDIPF